MLGLRQPGRRDGSAVIQIVQGDITRQRDDAIVNAAHNRLTGGGGWVEKVLFVLYEDETLRPYLEILGAEVVRTGSTAREAALR